MIDWSIVLSILQFIGVLVAAASLLYATRQYRADLERRKMEKSLELSKYFADTIIPLSNVVLSVYKIVGVHKKLNELLKNVSVVSFDMEYLREITTEDQYVELKGLISKTNDIENIDRGMYNSTFTQVELTKSDSEQGVIDACRNKLAKYYEFKRDLRNVMEWFSMQFTIGVADEACVYQSLHGTFCSIVQVLFYDYCISNDDRSGASRVFTNTELLYNTWNTRHMEVAAQEAETINNAKKQSTFRKTLGQ